MQIEKYCIQSSYLQIKQIFYQQESLETHLQFPFPIDDIFGIGPVQSNGQIYNVSIFFPY